MALDLSDCQFQGPALPEPFVKLELEKELLRLKLLSKTTGAEGKKLAEQWELCRRKLRDLATAGGALRVRNHIVEPLMPLLGYTQVEAAPEVKTREDLEAGGCMLLTPDGQSRLRVWTTNFDEDLFAPSKRGRAYRFSHLRVAQRVLLASGERIGLLTNGVQLLILISDPARPDSTISIPIDPGWKRSRDVPDSLRLLLALASPAGVAALVGLVEKARLQQARVTKDLRAQARQAVERFLQEILDHPNNQEWFHAQTDRDTLARNLWREGLVTVYRLLFILKLESSDDVARSFSFASTSLWRNTFSPSMALAGYAHDVLEKGHETGSLLESGLRSLFRMFEDGLECTELVVKPLGGTLFGANTAPILAKLTWGERAVAWLLDRLLWTTQRRGEATRQRVHYGPLDVEDLGRVYEALLELEPGISAEPMCRLRRQKLEVVVLLAQGAKYRPADERPANAGTENDEEDDEEPDDEEQPTRGKKTKVEWIEEIQPCKFYLRVGLGRKSTGSYYTPHSFVRFLVQETLGPQVAERSPPSDPHPLKILELKVLDPAMGSGHFLVEACRFLSDKLYEACRLCDEKALAAERRAEKANKADHDKALEEAGVWRQRVIDLPDPDDELVKYLPSRSPEGEVSGFSQQRAESICRRLIAVHCLYGVDKNPLAVELAKLALWLESHAEGMPLTFLDHRFVVGDSLTGPFWNKLIFRPGHPEEVIKGLFNQDLDRKLGKTLQQALRSVQRLEATVGITVAEMREKEAVKVELDRALFPFRIAAAAWSGGVMLGPGHCDDQAYTFLLQTVAKSGDLPEQIESEYLREMIAWGMGVEEVPAEREALRSIVNSGACIPALSFDLTFPEVFYPTGVPLGRQGFHAVLGNPPWDRLEVAEEEYWSRYDLDVLSVSDKDSRQPIIDAISTKHLEAKQGWDRLQVAFDEQFRIFDALNRWQSVSVGETTTTGRPDLYRLFCERNAGLLGKSGWTGVVVPSAFHANEGATGVRQLYLQQLQLQCCYSFENRRKLFEIHSSFKFACIVAHESDQATESFRCAYYLHDDEWLFQSNSIRPPLRYSLDFVRRSGGQYLTLPECRTQVDVNLLDRAYSSTSLNLSDYFDKKKVELAFGVELHRNRAFNNNSSLPHFGDEVPLIIKPTESSLIPVVEGKGFNQFTDRGEHPVRVEAPLSVILEKTKWNPSLAFYRLAYRAVASSTNERSLICAVLMPGIICNHSIAIETTPNNRSNASALKLLGMLNTYFLDWQVRQKTGANLSAFIIRSLRIEELLSGASMVIHGCLRLTCNHVGYASLWNEQLGTAWREPDKLPFTWPVLAGDDERWAVRAAIDAVVADAYGLSRDQYVHVLSTFSHSSFKSAPDLCLARFDELQSLGLDAFTKKHDPYWDIPLNENLPKPVIDLPMPAGDDEPLLFSGVEAPEPKKRGRKKT